MHAVFCIFLEIIVLAFFCPALAAEKPHHAASTWTFLANKSLECCYVDFNMGVSKIYKLVIHSVKVISVVRGARHVHGVLFRWWAPAAGLNRGPNQVFFVFVPKVRRAHACLMHSQPQKKKNAFE